MFKKNLQIFILPIFNQYSTSIPPENFDKAPIFYILKGYRSETLAGDELNGIEFDRFFNIVFIKCSHQGFVE